jgi:ATP-dependent DNA helicase RecG
VKLTQLKGLSDKRLKALNQYGIHTPGDLINFFPRRLIDRSKMAPIASLAGFGDAVTVVGKVIAINMVRYRNKKRLEVTIEDDTGQLKGVWFKGTSYFQKFFKEGQLVAFYGTVKQYGRHLTIAHPDTEKLSDSSDINKVATIVPVYPSTNFFKKTYITSTLIQNWIRQILHTTHLPEFLPEELLKKYHLPNRDTAYRLIHNPEDTKSYYAALYRLKFEELFLFQLSMAKLKQRIKSRHSGIVLDHLGEYTHRFFNEVMPFTLTEGQKNSLSAIKRDLRSGQQMNRLIQGDVGAGKTIVAIGAMLMALDNGYQASFMAPTEILAEQHYRTLNEYLAPLDINVRLLTGNQKTTLRRDILTDIQSGNCQIVVGTHAIIQKEVQFAKLGLAVIDEQHRFGVLQRADLLEKGNYPHILVMSATPIPRSLAMTLYGDLDVSLIKGLPAGRKPIKTAVRGEKSRKKVYKFLEEVLTEGGQAYIVYPLVEESEALDLKDATMGYEHIQQRFPGYSVGLLHGRMKSEEKDEVMRSFINNELQILVSTTVIEVGVDVPNASVMIIEHAERFGLSQLHQLRGRIGRGSRQSFCILMADVKQSKEAKIRLKTMAESNDGFKIAEVDLKLRGPGDFLGTKQSGLPDFKIADILQDQELLIKAKDEATELIKKDPDLELSAHKALRDVFFPYFKEKARFYNIT